MKNQFFTARKIAYAAMFSALAYALTFLEFPIFPSLPFLKLDFSFAILLLSAYMLGPVLGEIMVIIVQSLSLIGTTSIGVGQLANFIVANAFIVLPSIIYVFKKGFASVVVTLLICTAIEIVLALLSNRFITFPLFMGESGVELFNKSIVLIALFNLIKCVSNGAICVLLYKRLKKFLFKEKVTSSDESEDINKD